MPLELYHSYIGETDDAHARLWERLPPVRREQLAARAPSARTEGAALSALLTHAIAGWGCGVPFQTVPATALTTPFSHWETADNGKPFPTGIATPHGVAFASFSHSHGHLLVALCDRPLGADLQTWDAPAFAPDRFARLAARITHPAETLPATPRETARRFAAKEAVLKLSGDGLRRPMDAVNTADVTVTFCEEIPSCVIAVAVSEGDA